DYYKNTFGRDSYDGGGATLVSSVHYYVDYDNAFWDPDFQQMVYGDGDGVIFSPLGNALDVVAHELTHAITERTANLAYHNQSGALNESYSDVFACMVDPDWLIAETVYLQPPYFLRSLSNPPAGGQPDNVNDFAVMSDDYSGDYGGVHKNSGIPNKVASN
ncbi:MAG: M4 family metallopeptidase, partial [Chloroflexi bacterium]|nr:M4 family metallopeptidase [Chloroflexota bacterium]